jgi:hypothetical protein
MTASGEIPWPHLGIFMTADRRGIGRGQRISTT